MNLTFSIGEERVEVEILERIAMRHGAFETLQNRGDLSFTNAHEVPEISKRDFSALNSGRNWMVNTSNDAEYALVNEKEILVRMDGRVAILFRTIAAQFSDALSEAECLEILQSFGALKFRALFFATNLYSIDVPVGQSILWVERRLNSEEFDGKLVFAEPMISRPIGLRSRRSINDTPHHKEQWQWPAIQAPEVWKEGFKGVGVRVAVIDRGFDYSHPNLAPAIDRQRSMVIGPGSTTSQDFGAAASCSHGNMCAAQVGARPRKLGDLSGVAPESELILVAANTTDCSVALPQAWLAECVAYAAEPRGLDPSLPKGGADVITCSEGPEDGIGPLSSTLRSAFEFVAERNIPIFWAVANRDVDIAQDKMASFRGLIRVGTCGRYLVPPSDCAYGDLLDLLAPGTDIFNLYLGVGYNKSGTSFATPVAAGVAALMLQSNPNLGPHDIREILRITCHKTTPPMATDPEDRHKHFGSGIINAEKAVKTARSWVPSD